jgi:gliding-associated putative ABC transporter substrate-binding component GldG
MKASKSIYSNYYKQGTIILSVGLVFGIAYVWASYFPVRLDLTADKRYTLHTSTRALLNKLQSAVHADIYLAGDLPTEFKQLQLGLRSLLDDCQAYASHPIVYQLVDINQEPVEKRKALIKKLMEHGLTPTNLYKQAQGQRIEKLIYPAMIMSYQGKEFGVNLLKSNRLVAPEVMISQSMENLEYEVVSSLAKLVQTQPMNIGLVQGHGEPSAVQLHGLTQALQSRYNVHQVVLTEALDLTPYQALLITKPQLVFSEIEKYKLDQYIMRGGKVLFFIDRLKISMDSLSSGSSFAFSLDINLDDQLFRYGVRINQDLIKDLQAGIYPIIVGKMGNQPHLQFLPWPFFPILNHFSDHVITKNMNAVYAQFVNSIDFIQVQGVTQTPLLFSSPHSIKAGTPVYLDLESLRKPPDTKLYQQGLIPVACLLEGRFTSLYKNRILPEGADAMEFVDTSQPTKLLVVASGSVLLNAVSPKDGHPLPWGYDPFLQQHFANPDFVLNTLAYMLEETGMINAKHKTIQLRLLNHLKVQKERLYWQLINTIGPIVFLTSIGVLWYVWRRLKYRE